MSRNVSPDARIRDPYETTNFALPGLDMPDPIGHRHTANRVVLDNFSVDTMLPAIEDSTG